MDVIVTNKIIVREPTEDLKCWCKNNLVLNNPEYHKKMRMGVFVGNTPKYIVLYEIVGNVYYLPFGCLDMLWKVYGKKCEFKRYISPFKPINYKSGINLYPYQEKAVNEAYMKRNGIILAPCGSGKTQMGIELISRIKGRTLWLTHTKDLLKQSMDRAKAVLGVNWKTYGTITDGKVNIGEGITFATVQTMAKLDLSAYKDAFDCVIVDECFPAHTKISTPYGYKELQHLHIDDIITSYNRHTGKIEYKPVKHLFRLKAHNIVKVKLLNGKEIVCTDNHPFYTKKGQWKSAKELECDDYVMQYLWKRDRLEQSIKDKLFSLKKKRFWVLLKRVFIQGYSAKTNMDRRAKKNSIRKYEENKRKVQRTIQRKNDNKQSYEKQRNKRKGFKEIKRNRTSSQNKMWKWYRIDSTATNIDAGIGKTIRNICRISNTDKNGKRYRIYNLLQGGYSNSTTYDSNRSRWSIPQLHRKTKSRQEENRVFEWIRVESIEVQEQTSDGTFGGLCEDGFVYNIEVADNNNYFANDILVHNCQHCAGSPTKVTQFYKVVSSLSARFKYGLTATLHRADGLEQSIKALLGDVVAEVSREDVAETTSPVIVEKKYTGYMPDMDVVLAGDGTVEYSSLVKDMVNNEDRFKVVMDTINSIDGSMIVLANRVEYLQKMNDAYTGKSVCISGMSNSKASKRMRENAIEQLKAGEIDCIFATYQLCAEGLDVPSLRYVVFATPEKDLVKVTQSVGRVGRKADGKDKGIVIDVVDAFGMYKGWEKKRDNIYKKLNYKIM